MVSLEMKRAQQGVDDYLARLREENGKCIEEFGEDANGDPLEGVQVDDITSLYFREMAEIGLLSAEQEVELAKRIEVRSEALDVLEERKGELIEEERQHLIYLVEQGQEAREQLAAANTRLVVSVAKRYMNRGLSLEELIQEGNVGLMKAVDKFDYRMGNRFSTYAVWPIRQMIILALSQKTRTIRLPLHMTEKVRSAYEVGRKLKQELGRKPTEGEIGEELGMSEEKVEELFRQSGWTTSLNKPIGEEGDAELGDLIESDAGVEAEQEAGDLRVEIEGVLNQLTPREAEILRLRFGLGGKEDHTLEEVGEKFGLSRERIRQIEQKALKKLRRPQHANRLREYKLSI